jgi:hypothetical protein
MTFIGSKLEAPVGVAVVAVDAAVVGLLVDSSGTESVTKITCHTWEEVVMMSLVITRVTIVTITTRGTTTTTTTTDTTNPPTSSTKVRLMVMVEGRDPLMIPGNVDIKIPRLAAVIESAPPQRMALHTVVRHPTTHHQVVVMGSTVVARHTILRKELGKMQNYLPAFPATAHRLNM